MSAAAAVALFAAGTAAAWLLLVGFVLLRKAGRDRRERASFERRTRYAELLGAADGAGLAAAATELAADADAQTDLIAVARTEPRGPRPGPGIVAADGGFLARYLVLQAEGPDATARGRAGLLLAYLGLPGAVETAATLLGDRDGDVRLAACAALAATATEEGARALIAALDAGQLRPERVIERLGAPWAVAEVLAALRASHPPDVRAALVRALGLAPDPRAVRPLADVLAGGTEEERISAARSLGSNSGAAAAVPALCGALDDSSAPVRSQAARALGRLLGGASAAPEQAAAAAGHLRRRLSDADWWVRANAGSALAALGTAGATELRAALDDPDRFARDRARESLAVLEAAGSAP